MYIIKKLTLKSNNSSNHKKSPIPNFCFLEILELPIGTVNH